MRLRRVRKSIIAGLLLGLLALGAFPATAHDAYRTDPNDIDGKTDIRGVLYRHGDGRTTVKTKTFDPLRRAHLSNGNYMVWALDTVGNNFVDYWVYGEYRSGPQRYFCFIYDDLNQLLRRVEADKRASSLKCTFRSGNVSGVAEGFKASAKWAKTFDYAPEKGLFPHGE